MKHLFTSIALLLIVGASAQPDINSSCNNLSSWSGLGLPGDNAYILINGQLCSDFETDSASFAYWGEEQPYSLDITIPSGHDLTKFTYGLKGHGGIGNHPSNPALNAVVFETHMQINPDKLQNPEQPEFKFRLGQFEFDYMLADEGTTITIADGATVTVNYGLVLNSYSTINVEPGGTLILSASADHTCVIDDKGGEITGTVTREIYRAADYSAAWNGAVSSQARSLAFPFTTGLVNVNMHQATKMIQDTIGISYFDGSTERPTIQMSTWGHAEDLVEDFGYLAHNAYMKPTNFQAYQALFDDIEDTHINPDYDSYQYWGGPVALDGGGIFTLESSQISIEKRIPTIGLYGFDKQMGVATMPLYSNNDNTLSDLFADQRLLKLATGATGGTDEYQNLIATSEIHMPWMTHITDIPTAVIAEDTAFTFSFEGNYDGTYMQTLVNTDRMTDDVKDHEGTYYRDTMYHTYVEASGYFDINNYVNPPAILGVSQLEVQNINANANEESYAYHFIDVTGLNLIQNKTQNFLNLHDLALQVHTQAPYSQLAFYDVSGLPSVMSKREIEAYDAIQYDQNIPATQVFHEERNLTLPIVSNYITLPYGDGEVFFDMLNLNPGTFPQVNTYASHGSLMNPNGILGFNYVDPYNPARYNLSSVDLNLRAASKPVAYKNMGAEVLDPPAEYSGIAYNATDVIENFYDYGKQPMVLMDATADGVVESKQTPVIDGQELSYSGLDSLNVVTLLELHGENAAGETYRLATIPLAYHSYFNGTTANQFKSSVGVNPAFYILNNNPTKVAETMVGAFSRGFNENVDSLRIVVAPEYLPGEWTRLFVKAPVAQSPETTWNDPWHWTISPTEYGAPITRLDNEDFVELEVYNSGLTNPHTNATGSAYDVALTSIDAGGTSTTYAFEAGGYQEEIAVLTVYSGFLAADLNIDGCVTTADILLFLGSYGLSENDPGYSIVNDFNADGYIGISDLQQLLSYFNDCWNGTDPILIEGTELLGAKKQRLETMARLSGVSRTYSPYNIWTDYAWPDQQMKAFVQDQVNGDKMFVFVADEFGWIHWGQPLNNGIINLPSRVPTNAELEAMTDPISIPTGLRIYMKTGLATQPPGYSAPTNFFCLGCSTTEIPNNPTTALPVFE